MNKSKILKVITIITMSVLTALSITTTTRAEAADRVVFLNKSTDSMQARIDLIRRAKNEIYIQMYEVGKETDLLSETSLALLLEKAISGVQVYLVMDSLHSYLTPSTLRVLTSYPTFHIKLFSQFDITKPLQYNNRMHNKLMVADGKQAIVGGRNATIDYYNLNCNDVVQNYWDTDVLILGDGSPDSAVTQFRNYSRDFFHMGALVDGINYSEKHKISFYKPITENTENEIYTQSSLSKHLQQLPYMGYGYGSSDSKYLLDLAKHVQKGINKSKIKLFSRLETFRKYGIVEPDFIPEISGDEDVDDGALEDKSTLDSKIKNKVNDLVQKFAEGQIVNKDSHYTCVEIHNNEPIFKLEYNHSPIIENTDYDIWESDWGKIAESVSVSQALVNNPFHKLNAKDFTNIAHQIWNIIKSEFTVQKISELPKGVNPKITIISPYVNLTKGFKEALIVAMNNAKQVGKNLEINLITNSSQSTDEVAAQDCFEADALPEYLELGANIYLFKGTLDKKTRIGHLHQKTIALNDSKFLFGSFNSDYRSSEINLETVYYFDTTKNPLLVNSGPTGKLQANIQNEVQELMNNSEKINRSTLNLKGIVLNLIGLCKQM